MYKILYYILNNVSCVSAHIYLCEHFLVWIFMFDFILVCHQHYYFLNESQQRSLTFFRRFNMDMGMKFKDTYLEMVDEIVWGTICIPANQIYGFQTPANCHRWVTSIITITETMALSKAGCPVLKRSTELLKCLHLRCIITEWV